MGEVKTLKIAVSFGRQSTNRKLYCSCGTISEIERFASTVCPACDNREVIYGGEYPPGQNTYRRFKHAIFDCVEKQDNYFHLKKAEFILTVRHDRMTVKLSNNWELKYSLKDRSITLIKNGKEVDASEFNMNSFFSWGRSEYQIIPIFATEKSKHLFEYALEANGKNGWERTKKLGRALVRLLNESPKIELFANAGFGTSLRSIARNSVWMQSKETKPHKILGVPKYALQILRGFNSFSRYDVDRIRKLDGALGGNNVKLMAEIFKEESDMGSMLHASGEIIQLYEQYGYKDVRRLSLYLAREVKLEQGITRPYYASTYLRDYVRMCREMGVEPKEKYPKSLIKAHDVAQMNYQAKQDEAKNEQMRKAVSDESYQGLTYKKKPYAIITPKDASDLIKEGSSLSHCVASYVNDVITGKCKILFMRSIDELDKPLITIEVRDGNIRQVRGFGNRNPDRHEMAFVQEWADVKGLRLAIH